MTFPPPRPGAHPRIRTLQFALLLTLITWLPLHASAQDAKLAPEKRILLEDAIAKFMTSSGSPGIAASVVLNGQEAWSEGFGMADLENNVPVTPQTLFRLASISKPITAIAAMQLREQGKLDLDAPVQKYCPTSPPRSGRSARANSWDTWAAFAITAPIPNKIWKQATRSTSTIRSWEEFNSSPTIR